MQGSVLRQSEACVVGQAQEVTTEVNSTLERPKMNVQHRSTEDVRNCIAGTCTCNIRQQIGFIRSEMQSACLGVRPGDREWILALIVTEVEKAYVEGLRQGKDVAEMAE